MFPWTSKIVVFILKKVKSCTSFCTQKLIISIDKNSYKFYTQAKQVIYEILCHPFHGPICLFVRSSNFLCLDHARPSHTWYWYKFLADGLHDHSSVRVDHSSGSCVPEVFRSIWNRHQAQRANSSPHNSRFAGAVHLYTAPPIQSNSINCTSRTSTTATVWARWVVIVSLFSMLANLMMFFVAHKADNLWAVLSKLRCSLSYWLRQLPPAVRQAAIQHWAT